MQSANEWNPFRSRLAVKKHVEHIYDIRKKSCISEISISHDSKIQLEATIRKKVRKMCEKHTKTMFSIASDNISCGTKFGGFRVM